MTAVSAPAPATAYSRVTLVSERARADLVLPSGEPVGSLLPDILTVLGYPTDPAPRRLAIAIATATGALVPADTSLTGAGVLDGAVLRLVADDAVPPPPVVNDVTEEIAGDLDRRTGRWSATARVVTAVGVTAVAAAVVAAEIDVAAAAAAAANALTITAVACWVAAIAAGALRARWPGTALGAAGGAVAVVAVLPAAAASSWTTSDRIGGALLAGFVTLAVIGGAAWHRRGPVLGAVVGVVLCGGWVALRRSPLAAAEADGLVCVAAVVLLGLLPRWALTASGLASLDDRRMGGAAVSRRLLDGSLVSAHVTLVWSTLAAGAALAVTGASLAGHVTVWPLFLAGAAALVTALRSRTFPLVAEVIATLTASIVVAVALLRAWVGGGQQLAGPVAVTAAVALAAGATLLLDPAPHVRARLRGWADRLEAAAVIALLPLLIGLFGVFGRLLHTF